jgi:hypothetical protein
MVIAPEVSSPQYGEVVAFVYFLFKIFSITCTGRKGRPILTRRASNGAVPLKEAPFGGHNKTAKLKHNRFLRSFLPYSLNNYE